MTKLAELSVCLFSLLDKTGSSVIDYKNNRVYLFVFLKGIDFQTDFQGFHMTGRQCSMYIICHCS